MEFQCETFKLGVGIWLRVFLQLGQFLENYWFGVHSGAQRRSLLTCLEECKIALNIKIQQLL